MVEEKNGQTKGEKTMDQFEMDREDAKITAWILTGLRHEAIRLSKMNRQLREHELLILNQSVVEDVRGAATEMIDLIATQSDTLEEVEINLFVQSVLTLLTLQQQKVIILTVLEGAKEQEVAEEMGISQPAVHQLKTRALNRLRKSLIMEYA
jgi:RNA polymerase sigma factor (sigma-70 family)